MIHQINLCELTFLLTFRYSWGSSLLQKQEIDFYCVGFAYQLHPTNFVLKAMIKENAVLIT
ncbi:CLUMA_CG008476, isoform A [Clunio marinus]|uniref:CLUMA_CG008476, isoform A n=1 Tax=Clunio marinus TaxID=568069 RepID=A0A1J1I3W6_9DIPT|nr:CLUMA_CG008476, isoform A [Clunio marinus]